MFIFIFLFISLFFGTGDWTQECLISHWATSPAFFIFILGRDLAKLLRASLNCWGCLWTHNPPALASWAAGLQICATSPGTWSLWDVTTWVIQSWKILINLGPLHLLSLLSGPGAGERGLAHSTDPWVLPGCLVLSYHSFYSSNSY